ncbi:MFS transporter [Jiangella asiatica]|uniref:MFS transporter n=1 Tax=Jiangella asiatica TaxID=2530372 RepID=A0A4R5CKD1_9ACTN|nr:MFS transporter [Jiangella asiatica]TDE00769.1 MFS transporter [Jiangella asiatica]
MEYSTTTPSRRAGRREWIGLAVLALPTLLLALDMSVLYLALPHLSADLGADGTQQLWIMDVYGFMVAGFLVTMGNLGDRIGRRRLLLIGAAAFSVASVLAAYSVNAEMLILTRALLGIAGATLMPSTLALLSTMFTDARQRGVAIACWMSCFMGGAALGPVVGGALLETFWWGAAFLLGVPVMVVLLVTGPVFLPEYRNDDAGPLDLISVALSLATVLPVVYGLKELAKHGVGAAPLIALLAGTVFGVTFARRQRRLPSPLLDLRLFANRTFSSALTIWLLFGAIQGGTFLFFTLYLQTVAGLTPMRAGLWLLPGALGMIVSSLLAPHIAHRTHSGNVIAAGLLIAAAGYAVLTRLDADGGLVVLVVGFVVALVGVGLAASVGTAVVVGSVPPSKAGAAAALSETCAELGIALGVASIGSLVTSIYRSQVTVPSGVPADSAAAARESITGAVAAVPSLPQPDSDSLLQSASEAFTSALSSVAGLSATLFVGLAVLAMTTLRQSATDEKTVPASSVPVDATDQVDEDAPAALAA